MAMREGLLADTFVQLADTLVDDFDVIDVLTLMADRCTALIESGAAGILVLDQQGELQVVAATSEKARLLELFQLQNQEGPCLDCVTTGQPVINEDLSVSTRWPSFGPEALAAGFVAVQAVPMRLRTQVIGALNIFMDRAVLEASDLVIAQALADVATIAICQTRAAQEAQVVNAQLQHALNSRVAIEQAKGVLAERSNIDMDEAFARLRRYARHHNRQLSVVARELAAGTLPAEALASLTTAGKADTEHS